jgi:hypothetical protein
VAKKFPFWVVRVPTYLFRTDGSRAITVQELSVDQARGVYTRFTKTVICGKSAVRVGLVMLGIR